MGTLSFYARPRTIHWDIYGFPHGFVPKPWGALISPLATTFTFILLLFCRAILSPKGYEIDRFARAYITCSTATIGFLFYVNLVMNFPAIGIRIDVVRFIFVGVGIYFVVFGNYMGKATKNWFFGIRTPWALSNDEVWLRTQRLAGKLFVLCGLAIFLLAFLNPTLRLALFFVVIVSGAAIPFFYSYILYRRIESGNKQP